MTLPKRFTSRSDLKPQDAVTLMKELLGKRPNLLPAQMLLSQAYRIQGNLNDAAQALHEQIRSETAGRCHADEGATGQAAQPSASSNAAFTSLSHPRQFE